MILKVINDQRPIENGQFVAFLTGRKSINTYPKYLRVGKVTNAKNYEIEELENKKTWKVYPTNIITVGDNGLVNGIKVTLELTDRP